MGAIQFRGSDKLTGSQTGETRSFELVLFRGSDKLTGSQTFCGRLHLRYAFRGSDKLTGSQTTVLVSPGTPWFRSSDKLIGSQTWSGVCRPQRKTSLRRAVLNMAPWAADLVVWHVFYDAQA